MSSGLIPNILTKKAAWSGLNTIYARKLPKNITAIRRSDPINLITVHAVIGSRFFFAEIIFIHVDSGFVILLGVFCSSDANDIFSSWEVLIIWSSKDGVSLGSWGDSGVVICKNKMIYLVYLNRASQSKIKGFQKEHTMSAIHHFLVEPTW